MNNPAGRLSMADYSHAFMEAHLTMLGANASRDGTFFEPSDAFYRMWNGRLYGLLAGVALGRTIGFDVALTMALGDGLSLCGEEDPEPASERARQLSDLGEAVYLAARTMGYACRVLPAEFDPSYHDPTSAPGYIEDSLDEFAQHFRLYSTLSDERTERTIGSLGMNVDYAQAQAARQLSEQSTQGIDPRAAGWRQYGHLWVAK